MKMLFPPLCGLLLTGCLHPPAPVPVPAAEQFKAVASAIDGRLDAAPVEEYILALPAFAVHEETVEEFAERVRAARVQESANQGRNRDSLFVSGDGSWPAKEFSLDRQRRVLTIRIFGRRPDTPDETREWRRVPGGWLRGGN